VSVVNTIIVNFKQNTAQREEIGMNKKGAEQRDLMQEGNR
jgi:hypothetical protein